jgi:hypothetical protein
MSPLRCASSELRGRGALESLNFFMADMQAGIGPFLGVFLRGHEDGRAPLLRSACASGAPALPQGAG